MTTSTTQSTTMTQVSLETAIRLLLIKELVDRLKREQHFHVQPRINTGDDILFRPTLNYQRPTTPIIVP